MATISLSASLYNCISKGAGTFLYLTIWIYTFQHSTVISKQWFNHVLSPLLRFQVSITWWTEIPQNLTLRQPRGRKPVNICKGTIEEYLVSKSGHQTSICSFPRAKDLRLITKSEYELTLEWGGEKE